MEDVVVEVAPAELAAKRVGPLAARQPLLDRAHREAAEVQVRGQARGVVAPERVVVVGVVADRAVEEAVERPARLGLAADGGLADLLAQPERRSDGIRPFASREGSGGSSRGAASTSRRGMPSQLR